MTTALSIVAQNKFAAVLENALKLAVIGINTSRKLLNSTPSTNSVLKVLKTMTLKKLSLKRSRKSKFNRKRWLALNHPMMSLMIFRLMRMMSFN